MKQTMVQITAEEDISQAMGGFPADLVGSDEAKLTLDIFETDDDFVFLVPIAGIDPKKIQVLITEDVLTISGDRIFPEEFFTEERTAFLEECYWGKFSRSIVLPVAVNSEDASAQVKNGVLFVRIPKAKKAKAKLLSVEML